MLFRSSTLLFVHGGVSASPERGVCAELGMCWEGCTVLNSLHSISFPFTILGVNSFLGGNRGHISKTLYERRAAVASAEYIGGQGGGRRDICLLWCVCGYI